LVGTAIQGPAGLVFGGAPKADGTAEYRSVEISKELSKDLVKLASSWQAKERKRSREGTLREYDCGPQPEDMVPVQFIDAREDVHLQRSLSTLKSGSDLTAWTPEDSDVGAPRSFIVAAELKDGKKVRFFGRITKGKQLEGPGRLVAFFSGQRFNTLTEQKAVIIDAGFDCVEVDGFLIIMKPNGFESLFAYETNLKERATAIIDGLEPYLEPEKLVALRSGIGTNRNLLRQIAGRIRIDLRTADPRKVRDAVKRCKLNVTVNVVDGKLKLGFEGNDPQGLIRLLTDRAVESIVSGTSYIATALETVGS
jgi:hypothetical protein